ncbi:MAG TPA: AAA family ATPase [Acidobacteria bacterium]|nr:AAA family ATPase [Acidobacteriota bacterium]
MITLPYGIADFRRIRREGMAYVDRTAYIPRIERLGSTLVFLRPRRFGKSLWLQTLANYYDVRRAEEFTDLFGGLAIGRTPTPRANRSFILQWNFSVVDPSGSVGQIAESLREHVSSRAKNFIADYKDRLPVKVETEGSATAILDSLLSAVRRTPHPLYLLIDEYDNFINEVMARDVETYRALVHTDGPFKLLFKAVKNATEGQGLERVFITGVSPVALNDLTSGFNIARNVSLEPDLAGLCGFEESEIRGLLEQISQDRDLSPEAVEDAVATMRTWYNGYRFTASEGNGLVYNPTNVLYFLDHLHRHGIPPAQLHDENLRTDRGKLSFLARTAAGSGVIEELTEGNGEIEIPELETSFSLDRLLTQLQQDRGSIVSLLYFMGLLTLTDVPGRLRVPNLVVQKLFLDRLLEIHLPAPGDTYAARETAQRFFRSGDLAPLLAFMEEKLLPVLSNRDRGGLHEMAIKALFLSILFDDTRYTVSSELELERSYADLCLLVRPEMRRHGYRDVLFELKLVRRKDLGKTGQELREMDEEALRRLPPVARALDEAREQARRYCAALQRHHGEDLELRSYAVVAVDLERLLGDEVA